MKLQPHKDDDDTTTTTTRCDVIFGFLTGNENESCHVLSSAIHPAGSRFTDCSPSPKILKTAKITIYIIKTLTVTLITVLLS